jgi:hypothetical protein
MSPTHQPPYIWARTSLRVRTISIERYTILPFKHFTESVLIGMTSTTDEDLIKYGFPEDVWYAAYYFGKSSTIYVKYHRILTL